MSVSGGKHVPRVLGPPRPERSTRYLLSTRGSLSTMRTARETAAPNAFSEAQRDALPDTKASVVVAAEGGQAPKTFGAQR